MTAEQGGTMTDEEEMADQILALTAENERIREWWIDSYDQEVRAGETLFAAFKKLRDERDKLVQDLAAANERLDAINSRSAQEPK